jgi:1-acyl-sn-glycerol-3-phosphate acyltransferase
MVPLQIVAAAFGLAAQERFPMIWHRGVCRIFGIDIEVSGKIARSKPILFVSNHTSYIDISVLGTLIKGSFVAKADVATWPLFGFLAKLQRTVFVDRRMSRTAREKDRMVGRLEDGDNLILFPEGTSGDGNRVLPFKSAYFALAEAPVHGRPLTVQPVSVAYTKLDHMPMGRRYRPYCAWYGDMELTGHLWALMGLGRITVSVQFHEPVTIERFASRKELAAYCQRVVAEGVSEAISGHLWREPEEKRKLLKRLRAWRRRAAVT